MATMVLLASFVKLGSNDLSSYASKIALTAEVEEKDVTTFASGGWKEVKGGLKSGSLAVMFKNSITDNELDEIMWGTFGTVVTFEVRLDNAAVGVSNPKYTGSVLVKKWAPISGSVGDVAEVDVEYPTSGAITRATS